MDNENLLKQPNLDPSVNLPLFSYSEHCPLTDASTQLRLITIHPAVKYCSPLRCTIQACTITDLHSYQALSYTWGPGHQTHSILVQGIGDIAITESLDTCLRHLRHETDTLTLWIDQVSINQKDTAEKNKQVLLMREAYSRADKVVVWLGQAANGTDELIDLLLMFGQKAKDWGVDYYQTKEHIEEFRNIISRVDMTDTKTIEWEAICNHAQEALSPHLGALWRFYQRPWFQRIWIVQEFSLGRNVVLVCGHKRADPDILHQGIQICSLASGRMWDWYESGYLELLRDKQPLSKLVNCRKKCQWRLQGISKGWSLLTHLKFLFSSNDPMDATDPRDRIFGLLALPSDADELNIVPEYDADTTVEQVYTRAARAIISVGQLELLNLCSSELRSIGNRGALPSWVPDWRYPPPPSFCNIKHPDRQKPYFSAGGRPVGTVGTQGALPSLLDDRNGVLALEGYVVDEIEAIGKAWYGEPPQRSVHRDMSLDPAACEAKFRLDHADAIAEIHHQILNFLDNVKEMCEDAIDKYSKAGQLTSAIEASLREAIWRVPIGDLADGIPAGGTQRATREYERAYDAFVRRSMRQKCRDPMEYVSKWQAQQQELNNKDFLALAEKYSGNMEEMKNKRLFLTKNGYVGMGPLVSVPGDVVVIFVGAQTPFVLRSQDLVTGGFVLLGEAYCHMVMDGEILQTKRKEKFFLV